MTFLGGLFLFALPLVAVPVLIHLHRGRQRDVIAWGAMRFLAQATTQGRRMERIEELLLMALRVGAIGAVILALAQPQIRSSWWGSGEAAEVVLIIDNSLSMARTVDDFSAFDLLKENVRTTIDDLSSCDEVHLMLATGNGRWLTAEGVAADSSGKIRLGALLDNIRPTLATADFLACLQKIMAMETEETPSRRRVVAFTDYQKLSWQTDALSSWKQLGAASRDAAVPFSIQVVDCGLSETEFDNLAVLGLDASRDLVQPGEPIDFLAEVTNAGQVESVGTDVEWLVDEEVVATTQLESLEPGQTVQHTTTLRLDETGCFAVSCRLAFDDQNTLDQQSTVVVEISDRIPILLVHDPETGFRSKRADQLFEAALGYVKGTAQAWHSVYEPKVMTSDALSHAKLSDYRCVVITSLADLNGNTLERLQSYVRAGGGLWVAIGEQISRDRFNRDWYDDGDGLSPVSVEALSSIADTNEPAGTIHPPSREHPATLQLANTTQLDIDEARIHQHWRLKGSSDVESDSISVLLESGDGSPLVVEKYLGQGRVLVQAFPLGLEWTNLPQLKSYVVMIHEWLDYLTAGATSRYNLSPGSTIVAPMPAGAAFASAELLTPDGQETSLVSHGVEGAEMFRYWQTQLPGLYRMVFRTGDEVVTSQSFYVARNADESLLTMLDEAQQADLFAAADIQFDSDGLVAQAAPTQAAPSEEPVWGFLLVALLVLLAGELLLSNWLARQRGGVVISTG